MCVSFYCITGNMPDFFSGNGIIGKRAVFSETNLLKYARVVRNILLVNKSSCLRCTSEKWIKETLMTYFPRCWASWMGSHRYADYWLNGLKRLQLVKLCAAGNQVAATKEGDPSLKHFSPSQSSTGYYVFSNLMLSKASTVCQAVEYLPKSILKYSFSNHFWRRRLGIAFFGILLFVYFTAELQRLETELLYPITLNTIDETEINFKNFC